jgi:transposase InsO family protein
MRGRLKSREYFLKRSLLSNQLRSPKLNGAVERVHWTHTEEFYEITESSFGLSELKDELLEWEGVYNTVRPHQALGYVTPLRFLEQWKEYSGKEDVSLTI